MKSRNFLPISKRAAASPEIFCYMRRAASSSVPPHPDLTLFPIHCEPEELFLAHLPTLIAFRRVFRQLEVAVVNHRWPGFLLGRMPQRCQAL